MYSIRFYTNTGFDTVNIPESPAILSTLQFYEAPLLDLIQPQNLSSVRIKLLYTHDAWIKYADYCMIYDQNEAFYYTVDGFEYTSRDVCVVSIVPDALTTAGGPAVLDYSDGIVTRMSTDSDNFGEFIDPDPLLSPSQLMTVEGEWIWTKDEPTTTILESSLDPVSMADTQNATLYTDGTNEVVVPNVTPLSATHGYSNVKLGNGKQEGGAYQFRTYETTGTGFFYVSRGYENQQGDKAYTKYPKVIEGTGQMRSLGVENSVIAQYELPVSCYNVTEGADGFIEELASTCDTSALNNLQLVDEYNSNLRFEPYTVFNNRINYSEFSDYHLMTAGGSEQSFMPYEIRENDESVPRVTRITDPRPDGKPYFRFTFYKGLDFMVSALDGAPWRNVPLVYEGASASWLTQRRAMSTRELTTLGGKYSYAQQAFGVNEGIRQAQTNLFTSGIGAALDAFSTIQNLGTPTAYSVATREVSQRKGSAFGGISTSPSAILSAQASADAAARSATFSREYTLPYLKSTYEANRRREMIESGAQVSFVVPDIRFPIEPSAIRDYYGNGLYVYRLCYTQQDLTRIDKLLTMYGYKVNKTLDAGDFSGRVHFDYVQAEGVHIIDANLPKWLREAAAAQLEAGVRVWHEMPNSAALSYNPIQT